MSRAVSKGRGFWKAALDRQEASGLSVSAFCREESLSDKTFYLWRRKLRSEVVEPLATRGFTELVIDPGSARSPKLEVTFDNGTRLVVTDIGSDDQLARFVSALRAND